MLDLSGTPASTLAQVLARTTMDHGDAVIHLGPQDSVRLDGVTKAELRANPSDLLFG